MEYGLIRNKTSDISFGSTNSRYTSYNIRFLVADNINNIMPKKEHKLRFTKDFYE